MPQFIVHDFGSVSCGAAPGGGGQGGTGTVAQLHGRRVWVANLWVKPCHGESHAWPFVCQLPPPPLFEDSWGPDLAVQWSRGCSSSGRKSTRTCAHCSARGSGRTSEAAPEAVRQAVGGGCRSGWGRLLSVTILKPALGVRGTVPAHRLGALKGRGNLRPWQCIRGAVPSIPQAIKQVHRSTK